MTFPRPAYPHGFAGRGLPTAGRLRAPLDGRRERDRRPAARRTGLDCGHASIRAAARPPAAQYARVAGAARTSPASPKPPDRATPSGWPTESRGACGMQPRSDGELKRTDCRADDEGCTLPSVHSSNRPPPERRSGSAQLRSRATPPRSSPMSCGSYIYGTSRETTGQVALLATRRASAALAAQPRSSPRAWLTSNGPEDTAYLCSAAGAHQLTSRPCEARIWRRRQRCGAGPDDPDRGIAVTLPPGGRTIAWPPCDSTACGPRHPNAIAGPSTAA
jgi:hypothetical protein